MPELNLSDREREILVKTVAATLEQLIDCAEDEGRFDVADWLRAYLSWV
jgi:hypothetical protein